MLTDNYVSTSKAVSLDDLAAQIAAAESHVKQLERTFGDLKRQLYEARMEVLRRTVAYRSAFYEKTLSRERRAA
jgi:hypothetical protein